MNRRSFFKRLAATATLAVLAPAAKFLHLPSPPPATRAAATLATYDQVLKKYYAPAILARLVSTRTVLEKFMDEDYAPVYRYGDLDVEALQDTENGSFR